MKHIGKELYSLIERKGLVKRALANQIDITPVYLSAIMRKDDISCSMLEKICKAIGVPPSYFFDDTTVVVDSTDVESGKMESAIQLARLREKVANLETILALKDGLLAEKERLISHLMSEGK